MIRTNSIWLILVFLVYQACTSGSAHEESVTLSQQHELSPTEVTTTTSIIKPFEYLISSSGIVQSEMEVEVQFREPGVIHSIRVKNGQQVKRGDLLAVLDNAALRLAFEKAKVQLDASQVSFEDQMISFNTVQDSTRLERIKENIRFSSGLAAAQIAYKEAKFNFENSFVQAPISGTITGLELNPSNSVKQGQVLCYIHNAKKLVVNGGILESDAFKVHVNTPVEVFAIASPKQIYKATITEIDPRVNPNTGMVKVKMAIEDRAELFPGMHVQAQIKVPFHKNVIVPKEAVVIRSGRQVIFTVEKELAKWNYITCGQENGKEVEILEGLDEGKEVILTNNLQLAHDAPVKVIRH